MQTDTLPDPQREDSRQMPLVSVIVRTKDRPSLLEEALASVAKQTYRNIELVVVNDGGQDVTPVVYKFEHQIAQIQYHPLPQNRGRAGAANVGLEKASGEYLIFLDDDDLFDPDHIAAMVEVMVDNAEIKVVYSGVRAVSDTSTSVFNSAYNAAFLRASNYIPFHAVLFDKKLLASGCRFDETFEVYEDWDFWLQLSQVADFFHLDRISATYRDLGNSGGDIFDPEDETRHKAKSMLFDKWRTRWTGAQLDKTFTALSLAPANHIRNLETFLAARNAEIDKLRESVQSLQNLTQVTNTQIQDLETSLANKEKELQDKNTKLHQAHELLADKETELAGLQNQIHHLREHIVSLLQVQKSLLESSSWRITAPIRKTKMFLRRLSRLYRSRLHRISLQAVHEVETDGDHSFRSTGNDPHFLLHSSRKRPPSHWIYITGRIRADTPLSPILYFADEHGFSEQRRCRLELDGRGRIATLMRLPDATTAIRLDPMDGQGRITIENLAIREIGSLQVARRILWEQLRPVLFRPQELAELAATYRRAYTASGWQGLKGALLRFQYDYDYGCWLERNALLSDADRSAIKKHIRSLKRTPRISILMPVYNTQERWLRAAINSVRRQLYPHWELCIADDASSEPHVRQMIEDYCRKDERIKAVFRESNGHISAASNSALQLATGEYLALLDHDDELAEHALYMVAVELNDHPEAVIVYSDEDKINEIGCRYDPYFKPDWNPLLLLGQNYLNHLTVYETGAVREQGGFREGLEGSQDWDLALRVSERIDGDRIRHIPHVLYHWRALNGSTALTGEAKPYTQAAAREALDSHFARIGRSNVRLHLLPGGRWHVRFPLADPPPKTSLIIPTRNGYEVFYRCVESIYQKTDYPDFEVIVVDNQSDDPRIIDYFRKLAAERGVKILHYDAPFNYSAINNFAVRQAKGELLAFLNNDLEVISCDWLYEMAGHAIQPQCGAVGAMLYYPDDRIQHAGVILGIGGVAGNAYVGKPRGHDGQMSRAQLAQNLSAVTAACLVVRRAVFEEVQGFDARNLPIAFNDVDLCLRIWERGYYNVWTPFAEFYHHESATRGLEDTPEKQARFLKECAYMRSRWDGLLDADPASNPNLTLSAADFSWSTNSRSSKPWLEVQSAHLAN